jgi:hypothetical protein
MANCLPPRAAQRWLACLLLLGIVGCAAAPKGETAFLLLPAWLPEWQHFRTIDRATVALPAGELNPFALARSLMNGEESLECFHTAQIRLQSLTAGGMALLVSRVGLCDDAVAAIEQRFDLIATPEGGWHLARAGERYACRRPLQQWAEGGRLCP